MDQVGGFGYILDISSILDITTETLVRRTILSHFDKEFLLERLLVDPDSYTHSSLFERLYDELGTSCDTIEWTELINDIDEMYWEVNSFVTSKLKENNKDASYQFVKWVNPSTAVIKTGSPILKQELGSL